nr:NfeD family protein [Thalassobacillus pellis]
MTKYTGLGTIIVSLVSIIAGIGAYMMIYHYLVIPMSKAESSTAISVQDLEGKIGEVITTIPLDGMGEVFIESTSGSRSESAKSFEEKTIKQGSRVVVVEVKEHILYVSEWEDQLG